MKIGSWIFFASIVAVTSVQASVLLYEPYPIGTSPSGYTAGLSLTSATNNSVAATTGSWTGNATGATTYLVSNTGLTYTNFSSSGGSIVDSANGTNTRLFSGQTTATYYSFLVNFSDFDSSVILGLANGGTVVSGLSIGLGGVAQARSNTGNSTATFSLSTGTTYLIVGEWIPGATDTTNIWIDPVPGGSQPAATLSRAAGSAGTVSQWYSFINTTSSQISNFTYDEFRVGTTFADVTPVPEPRVGYLLGLAAFLTVLCRYHRNQKSATATR